MIFYCAIFKYHYFISFIQNACNILSWEKNWYHVYANTEWTDIVEIDLWKMRAGIWNFKLWNANCCYELLDGMRKVFKTSLKCHICRVTWQCAQSALMLITPIATSRGFLRSWRMTSNGSASTVRCLKSWLSMRYSPIWSWLAVSSCHHQLPQFQVGFYLFRYHCRYSTDTRSVVHFLFR